ncbi:MAG: dTMP kinase [Deltaproteobacteria bacterium]|nr:dTMP kinase [Deltaproteobacteria bacterium]
MAEVAGGLFIAVEGGEGVGKSSFVKTLAVRLRAQGHDLVTSREPGGTPVADALRALFAHPPQGERLSIVTEALMVSAGRSQHCDQVIRPALAAGQWVLCDRYADSTRVYQGEMGGLSPAVTEELIAISTRGLRPHVTFVLDCPVDVSLQRLQGRSGSGHVDAVGRYDAVAAVDHERRRAAYLAILKANPGSHVLIDASASTEAMVTAALHHLEVRVGQT